MKTTGVIRKLDELGRITLPIELRRSLDLDVKDALEITEYSCAMKSHFRKFGNQMSGSGNHLCNYASLLA